MDLKVFFMIFFTIFLAELGDKTQLATILFASESGISRLTIFLGASLAMVISTGIGVLLGSIIAAYINPKYVSIGAGMAFIFIGIWIIFKTW